MGPYTLSTFATTYGISGLTLDLYAGAGQNILANGTLVGHVNVTYSGGLLMVHYTMIYPNEFEEIHLWGSAATDCRKSRTGSVIATGGKYTASPGLFPYQMSDGVPDGTGGYTFTINPATSPYFSGSRDSFYIAAHAVVRMYEVQ